jgi:hypothetical protein
MINLQMKSPYYYIKKQLNYLSYEKTSANQHYFLNLFFL